MVKRRKLYIFLVAIIIVPIIVVSLTGCERRDYLQDDTITYNGGEYSITKVSKDDEYIVVTIKIKNVGDKDLEYSDFNFVMLNQSGKQVDVKSLVFDDGTVLTNGTLKPNEEVEGTITWLQDKKNKSLRIRYYENPIMTEIDDYEFEWSLE